MKLTLAVQCISTWDFMPIEDETQIFINCIEYPHTQKKGGYKIITKELPSFFTLEIKSKNFLPFYAKITKVPKDKIILCELVVRFAPEASVFIEATPPASIVLGYGYFRLSEDAQKDRNDIKIKNPSRICLEGRRFLLHDTKSTSKEFITLGDATDITLSHYKIHDLKSNYIAQSSAILPTFDATHKKIPIRRPPQNSPIWIYQEGQERKLIEVKKQED